MAIKIKSISKSKKTKKSIESDFLYKDILLDLNNQTRFSAHLNQSQKLEDIQAQYDKESILVSIGTAFTTAKGEKILEPEYGVDLRSYLFEPINDSTLFAIESDILRELPRFEPRVTVDEVLVSADPDKNEIYIVMQLNIPTLNIYGLSIKSKLNSAGYAII